MTTEITADEAENFPDKPILENDASSIKKSLGSTILCCLFAIIQDGFGANIRIDRSNICT